MLIEAALAELGVARFLLAIHDVSFPCDPDEDIGRGAPTTRAAARLMAYARSLGFTGLQLGPQGQTSRGNPSPYDSTIFARHLATIGVSSFRAGGPYAGLVDERVLDAQLVPYGPAQHAHAYDASHAIVGAVPIDAARVARFLAANPWVADYVDAEGGASQLVAGDASWQLVARDERVQRFAMGQLLAHEEHARVRGIAARLGLALYGDLQVGYSDVDARIHAAAFLDDYVMGAPPSRTNPAGQPWNYPVLDPDQLDEPASAARTLLEARIDKAFAEYDSIRIDHPHGLVCPWVYRAGQPDAHAAVQGGARLYESPDLPDHPTLARYAIVRPDQIDRTRPRYHDDWVRDLDDAQVARYARCFDVIAACAARHGRAMADVSCEVLSTMPYPLGRVLARYGLGRWRVTQKANLDDASDVYRTENAQPADWVMLGNHDTPPIFALIRAWSPELRAAWVRRLRARLAGAPLLDDAAFARDSILASAMVAELFACPAENVSIFFADLFGYVERFNEPGTISPQNWCLRLPPDFDRVHRERLDRDAAIDIPLALALALAARGSTSGLAEQLRASRH